ncbi:hypothetical protein QA641_30995 [Bradyrhizobium sp. CB1650]|uniref:hypothetical protein n=1 Tax=Bradyrhizobium sp. CB1650 TaxID=3039153 RepID=UPI002435CD93|nr:hypothetical protein [Bradyrhizobium sp. CB1650]WGD50036.1 hypothetical protein QA641_30995 [Bradyrhizobium sp. CB1650]
MTSLDDFSAFAASRGEGLHPKLRELFMRTAAAPSSEVAVRPDGMLQAGPNPRSGTIGLRYVLRSREAGDTEAIRHHV